MSAPSTSTLVRTIGSVKRSAIPERLDRRCLCAFRKRGQVVLSVDVLDVRLKLCMLTSKLQPAAKEIPR